MINHCPLPLPLFAGNCLRMSSISIHQKVVNVYISYTLNPWSTDLKTDFTLGHCLFGAVELTKNTGPDKYKCSKYGVGSDSCS